MMEKPEQIKVVYICASLHRLVVHIFFYWHFGQLQFLKRFIFLNDAQFLTTRSYISLQNTIIPFKNVDF